MEKNFFRFLGHWVETKAWPSSQCHVAWPVEAGDLLWAAHEPAWPAHEHIHRRACSLHSVRARSQRLACPTMSSGGPNNDKVCAKMLLVPQCTHATRFRARARAEEGGRWQGGSSPVQWWRGGSLTDEWQWGRANKMHEERDPFIGAAS
jgi:hypothetical protein